MPTQLPQLTNPIKIIDQIYHYQPHWSGIQARCQLQIWRTDQGNHVVMFTAPSGHPPDNPGMSVTNFSENLATLIRRAYGLDVDNTIWIEYYPSIQLRQRISAKEYDLITYRWDLHTLTAHNPNWQRLDPAALHALPDQLAPAGSTAYVIRPTDAE